MPEILLLIIIYPLLFILYFIMKHSIHNEPNLCFGVTIPEELLHDTRIQDLEEIYYKKLLQTTIICSIFSTLLIITPSPSISITILYLWMFGTIVLFFLPYAQANIALKHLKVEEFIKANAIEKATLNQKNIQPIKQKYIRATHVILLIVTFAPILYSILNLDECHKFYSLLTVLVTVGSLNLLILWFSIETKRQKVLMLSSNPQVNDELAILKKRLSSSNWLILALMNTIYLYLVLLFFLRILDNFLWFLLLTYLYFAVVIYILLKCLQMIHKIQSQKLNNMEGSEAALEDDKFWIWGIFYHNPKEKKLFVKSRFTNGFTLNYAKLSARCINTSFLLLWYSGLVLCIWSVFMEYTPIKLSLNENKIIASQLREEYTFDLDSINSIHLLEESPIQLITDDFLYFVKGTYEVEDYGFCTFFMVPTNTYFIHIKTDTGGYLLSSYKDEETLNFYDQLLNTLY